MKEKLQIHEDTNWENLNDTGTIQGRILNGVATIIFKRVSLAGKAGANVQVITLPEKYKSKVDISFSLFLNSSSSQSCVAWNYSSGVVYCYIPKENGTYNGTLSYPIY